MSGLLILLAALGIPYVAFNLRRLRCGRSWAFTICQVAKEWEEGERAKREAVRGAERAQRNATRVTPPHPAGRPRPGGSPDF